MRPFKAIKRFFQRKYWALFELITFKLLSTVTPMVKKLLLHQGKDPDYVAPPTPDPVPVQTAFIRDGWPVFHGGASLNTSSNIADTWVRDPASHPIIKYRAKLKEDARLAKEKIEQDAANALEVFESPEVVEELPPIDVEHEEPLQVTSDKKELS